MGINWQCSIMYALHMHCILLDAHLSNGDQLVMLDVFPLSGIGLFKVSTRDAIHAHKCVCDSKKIIHVGAHGIGSLQLHLLLSWSD